MPSRRKRRPRKPSSLTPTTSRTRANRAIAESEQRQPHHSDRRRSSPNRPNATRQTTPGHRPGLRNRPTHWIRPRHPGHTISGTGQQGQARQAQIGPAPSRTAAQTPPTRSWLAKPRSGPQHRRRQRATAPAPTAPPQWPPHSSVPQSAVASSRRPLLRTAHARASTCRRPHAATHTPHAKLPPPHGTGSDGNLFGSGRRFGVASHHGTRNRLRETSIANEDPAAAIPARALPGGGEGTKEGACPEKAVPTRWATLGDSWAKQAGAADLVEEEVGESRTKIVEREKDNRDRERAQGLQRRTGSGSAAQDPAWRLVEADVIGSSGQHLEGVGTVMSLAAWWRSISGVGAPLQHRRLGKKGWCGIRREGVGRPLALRVIDLFANRLADALPSSSSCAAMLQDLSLAAKSFIGALPAALFGLAGLQKLPFASNGLTGRQK
ncbi:hypothetical protein BRADI_3g29116v3 [Brachypodium distachyon]|uniref:Uncharacterized protein n=1 Tax=Brachypodium distachyon TaxID=15368 RepID=A0A0Q3Q674_BRADI|nr:hypothetical protein BRADI_3g29116v3 [Brachypodium distachyon]